MSEWKEYKISDLGTVVTGKTPSSKNPNQWGNSVAFVTPSDFDAYNKSIEGSIRYLSDDGTKVLKSKLLPLNSVLVTCIGSQMGKVALNRIPCITNQQINSIIVNEKFSSHFVYYLVSSERDYLRNLATGGSTMPIINKSDFEKIKLKAPDLPTQTAIAEILSSLDDKIELNNKINQELENLAQTLFKQWFIDFEFPNENGEPYKSSGGEMVDSELGEIPKGWEVVKLKDCSEVSRGLSYKGSGLSDSSSGIPMINLNSVFEGGGYKYEGIKYYDGNFKESHLINPWDLAVANTEQGHKYLLIGYPAFVPKNIGMKAIFSHHIYRVRPKDSSYLTNQFFYYLIQNNKVREQIIGACNGTTVNMLKQFGLESPVFPMPPNDLILTFTELVSNLWNTYESNTLENRQLTTLRDTLLPKLISGELEVSQT